MGVRVDLALLRAGPCPGGGGEVEAREALELPRDWWFANGDDFRPFLWYPSCVGGGWCLCVGSTVVKGVEGLLSGREAAGLDANWPLAPLEEYVPRARGARPLPPAPRWACDADIRSAANKDAATVMSHEH